MAEVTRQSNRALSSAVGDSLFDLKCLESTLQDVPSETEKAPVACIYNNTVYNMDDLCSTLRSLQRGDFDDEKAIKALPRRRNKSQRHLALQLAKCLYPELSDMSAIEEYEHLTTPAKAAILMHERERMAAKSQPTSGNLLENQGPWAGQELDPLDLEGPVAIPMPVNIGEAEEFEPIFAFLAEDIIFEEASKDQSFKYGFEYGTELVSNAPLLEFNRGIVYGDGRLDLCKKVVGPTHIGRLMESLEPNHQIRHFLLGNNAISTTGAKQIAEFLEKYPDRMETWYLAGCHITQHGLSLLVPRLSASSTINNIWLKRNPLGPGSSKLLAELVLQTTHLRTLDLETTELGNEGTRRFIELITGHPSAIRNLYLNANGIGQSACVSLARYLESPHCKLESLFLSTNPIGDAGIILLAPGLAKNKTLKRFTCASAGLTSTGVSYLATAFSKDDHPLETLHLGASVTTKAHGQRFNHLDDACIENLKPLIMSPHLRCLDLGRTVFTEAGAQEIRSTAARSELVVCAMINVKVTRLKTTINGTAIYEAVPTPRSCLHALHYRLAKNQAKYYPHVRDYAEFVNSQDLRFLRNTSDVRQIDSMYRTRDKRLKLPADKTWEEDDPTWKLIVDAEMVNVN